MTRPLLLREDFGGALSDHWQQTTVGQSRIEGKNGNLRLVNERSEGPGYCNAQIDDYQGRARRDFLWRPPLTLTVRARFSHEAATDDGDAGLMGTAGFGFWNDPFLMTGRRMPTLPRALWFFYASPPSDTKLDIRTPGRGWKAATLDALRWSSLPLALTAPLTLLLMNHRATYRKLWPRIQRLIHAYEASLSVRMTEWHTYTIIWREDQADFLVDGERVLAAPAPPRGPLGLVLWKDNQYMIAMPWGHFGHGTRPIPQEQWLELDWLEIR